MDVYFQHIGITYGLMFFAILIAFLTIGFLLMRFSPSLKGNGNSYSIVLNAFAIGLTTVVPCFAIIWCKGNSIMWIAVLLWGFYYARLRCTKNSLQQPALVEQVVLKWDMVLIVLLSGLIVYLVFYYLFFVRSAGSFFFDVFFYGHSVAYMLNTHTESSWFQGLFPVVSAYHYGESWLSALVARLFGAKPLYAMVLCAYPLFVLLCVLGMASICKSISQVPNWVAIIAGFGALFVTPLPSLLNYGRLAEAPKGMAMASFVILGVAAYLDKNKMLALVILLMSVPFYSVIAPGVLTFCFCFAVYECSRQKTGWESIANLSTILTLSVAVFFCLFYCCQASLPYSEPKESLYAGNWVYNALLFFVRRIGGFLVGIIPTLVILFLVLRKSDANVRRQWAAILVCYFISVMASGLVGGVMKQFERDGGQIFTNYMSATVLLVFYPMLLYVSLFVCSLLSAYRKESLSLLVVLIAVSSLCYYMHIQKKADITYYPVGDRARNEQQYDVLKDCFDGKRPVLGSFYLKGERFFIKDGSLLLMMPHVLPDGSFVNYDLSCLQVPETTPKVLDDSHGMALYQYVQIQKQQGQYISDEQSIDSFIKEKHIDYLIVQSIDEIPELYRDDAELVVVFGDESIYQLKL